MRVVLLTKRDRFSREAQTYARWLWPGIEIAEGIVGDRRPIFLAESGQVLISFLSPWIVTAAELARFPLAINFHPASTDYPGSGCYNFALYDEVAEYGATCHHMLPRVDTGRVIVERRFPVAADDSVETLKLRTMIAMSALFKKIASMIAAGEPLPSATRQWTRAPFTFAQLESLKVVEPAMSALEVGRRVRATTYPGSSGPVMRQPDGREVAFPVPQRAALA